MHFSTLVIIDKKDKSYLLSSVSEALAPYQENNMGDCHSDYLEFEVEIKKEDFKKAAEELIKKYPDNTKLKEEFNTGDYELMLREYYGLDLNSNGDLGYWYNPNSEWDWWVIGGRWSGQFSLVKYNQDKLKKFWQEFKKQGLGWTSKDKPEELQRTRAIKLFRECFPEETKGLSDDEIPVYRDSYKAEGYPDDIKQVKDFTQEEINRLSIFSVVTKNGEWYSDIDNLYEEFIKELDQEDYLVIVDCHI